MIPENRTTRVFNNGNSQAVRIPADFRLDTDRVQISRSASGDLILRPLQPLRTDRGQALLQALVELNEIDHHFVHALEADAAEPLPLQEREGL